MVADGIEPLFPNQVAIIQCDGSKEQQFIMATTNSAKARSTPIQVSESTHAAWSRNMYKGICKREKKTNNHNQSNNI